MRYWIFLWAVQGFAAFNLTWGMPAVALDSNPPLGDTDSNAVIAMNSMGNAVAAWSRTVGKAAIEEVWASVYNHSSRVWAPTLKISGSGSAENPQVVIDSEGNAILIWEEGFPTQIRYCTLNPNGIWAPDLTSAPNIISASKNAQTFAQIGMDDAGNALVVWMEFYHGKEHIHSAQKLINMPWAFLGTVSPDDQNAILIPSKSFASNPSGSAAVVWQQTSDLSEIYAATFENGIWSDPKRISEKGHNAFAPAVGIDHSGEVIIAWSQNNAIHSQSIRNQTLFPKPLIISNPGFVATHPDVGIDGNGNAIVIFERYNAIHKFICSSTLAKGGSSWSTPIDISGPSPSGASVAGYPDLCVNSIGDAVAIWKEFTGTNIVIQGAGYSLGTWSIPKTLSSLDSNSGAKVPAYDISVALNNAGSILAIWPEDPTMTGSLQIKSTTGVGLANFGPPPPLADPATYQGDVITGIQILHRFPAHADLINILKWVSPGNVDHFNIYRNTLSSLIATTKEAKYEDHQRIPKETVTYLITSVSIHGQESPPITIVVNAL